MLNRNKRYYWESLYVVQVEISSLQLDGKNYRFLEDETGSPEEELIGILDRDFEVIEIGKSIADNGFFPQEPLVAVREGERNIVVEGNRRLAALKLLTTPNLRHSSTRAVEWEELASRMQPISSVPVVFYPSRQDLLPVLGFRHILGVSKWEPIAKARFIDSVISEMGERADLDEISEEIGSTPDTVKNFYITYRAYVQARDEFELAVTKIADRFSLLYRALNLYDAIADFVGLVWNKPLAELRNPIPPTKKENLAELINYIYGDESTEPVLTDSRKLRELDAVIADHEALRVLRLSRDLAKAYQLSGGETQRLLDNLKDAGYYLDEALVDVHRHKTEDNVKKAVKRLAETFYQILRHFPELREEEQAA